MEDTVNDNPGQPQKGGVRRALSKNMSTEEIRRITARNYQDAMKSKVRHDQSDIKLLFSNHAIRAEQRINFKILDVVKVNQIFDIKSDANRASEVFERRHGISILPEAVGLGDLQNYWYMMDEQLRPTNFSLKATDYALLRQYVVEKMLPEYSRICCSNVINSIMSGVYSEKVRRGANKTFFKWVAKQLSPDSNFHKEMEAV